MRVSHVTAGDRSFTVVEDSAGKKLALPGLLGDAEAISAVEAHLQTLGDVDEIYTTLRSWVPGTVPDEVGRWILPPAQLATLPDQGFLCLYKNPPTPACGSKTYPEPVRFVVSDGSASPPPPIPGQLTLSGCGTVSVNSFTIHWRKQILGNACPPGMMMTGGKCQKIGSGTRFPGGGNSGNGSSSSY